MQAPKALLVVDDHPLIRQGLRRVIENAFPGCDIEEAPDGEEAVSQVWKKNFDLVLLDISLPGRNGLEVIKQLKAARPRVPVLVVSMLSEAQVSTRALRAGASGFVSKDAGAEVLVQAIRQAVAGGKFISQKVAELLASELMADDAIPVHQTLSDREYEILLRIGRGETVSEIADSLHLSVKTVSTYRTRVLNKMNLRNNADLVQYAVRNQLAE